MTEKRFHFRKMATTALLAVVLSFSAGTVTAQTYNPGDIAAINAIINNNGLALTVATPADGSYVPSGWTSSVITWSSAPTNKRIRGLYVNSKGLTGTLNVTALTEMDLLRCYNNNLTALNVSANTQLEYLDCYNNNLTTLNVSANTQLKRLSCHHNNLTTLNVSANTLLTNLYCNDNNLTALDVSANTLLKELHCNYNNLTALNVSTNTQLTDLRCNNNNITTLNVSANTQLTDLSCHSNNLTALDVSANTQLTDLRCFSNNLTTLNVSANTLLTRLDCDNNNLTTLNVTGLPLTYALRVEQNYMANTSAVVGFTGTWDGSNFVFDPQRIIPLYSTSDIAAVNAMIDNNGLLWAKGDPSGNVNPEWDCQWSADAANKRLLDLELTDLGMTGVLDATGLTALRRLAAGANNFTGVNVTGLTALETLLFVGNLLTSLPDLSSCTALNELNMGENPLTTTSFTPPAALANLESLTCNNMGLTSLDLSSLTKLIYLECDGNALTTLKLALNNTALKWLYCRNNHLAELDLTGITNLTSSNFLGDNQTLSLTLTDNGSGVYQRSISLNAPVFTESEITCAGGILSSTDNTVMSSGFTVETKQSGLQLSGVMNFTYQSNAGIAETTAGKISIYPNPAKYELKITNYEGKINNVEICDLTGRTVGVENFRPLSDGAATINVSSLPQGVYLVKIYTDKGNVVRKVVKE